MRGLCGYGRYDDDPEHVGCPYAKSDMTPCVSRDGRLALADVGVCAGCGHDPGKLLAGLADVYPPARMYIPDLDECADKLAEMVRAATATAS